MRRLLDSRDIRRSLARLAHEIVEQTVGAERLALVGIHTGGVTLAHRLAREIGRVEGQPPEVGEVDITLYRDDLYTGLEKPVLGETRLSFPLTGTTVVLVDDVLFTGRTVRAAVDMLMDYGRPDAIRLAVLVDRGHRELPIAADFVGRRLETAKGDRVRVELVEQGADEDHVSLEVR